MCLTQCGCSKGETARCLCVSRNPRVISHHFPHREGGGGGYVIISSDKNAIESFKSCPSCLVVETRQVCDSRVNGYLNFQRNK